METKEIYPILIAILVLFVVLGFGFIIQKDFTILAQVLLFAVIIIVVHVFAKKIMAFLLDADVEHKIWGVSRFGFKPKNHLKGEAPAGIILPLLFTLITLGTFRFSSILTYEAKATKYRAARRFGFYSYTELTDFHNALIGASGILAILLLSLITYFLPGNFEYLARAAAFYAFFNMLPISNLDGTQIFFGSRVLYTTVAILTIIFTIFALIPTFIII